MGFDKERDYRFYGDEVGNIAQSGDALWKAAQEKTGAVDDLRGEIKDLETSLDNDKFVYTPMGDELYHQYAQQYMRNADLAARDAVAESAIMTGGYGNSYGVTAGAQAFGEWMDKLNGVIPELRAAAYGEWRDGREDKKEAINKAYADLDVLSENADAAWADVEKHNADQKESLIQLLSQGYINGELDEGDILSLLGSYDDAMSDSELMEYLDAIEGNKTLNDNYQREIEAEANGRYADIISEVAKNPSLANELYISSRLLEEGFELGEAVYGKDDDFVGYKNVIDILDAAGPEVVMDGDNISEEQYNEAIRIYEQDGKDALLDYIEGLTITGVNTVGLEAKITQRYKDGVLVPREITGTGGEVLDNIRAIQGREYTMVDDGGAYIGKVNDNATYTYIEDGKEKTVTAKNIYEELTAAGLSKEKAKEWISKNLGGH